MTAGGSRSLHDQLPSLWLANRYLHYLALATIAVGLPLSKAMMSIGGIVLGVNWLLSFITDGISGKLVRLERNKAALSLSALYILHLLGLLYTKDLSYALDDLPTKLPLFFYPLAITTMPLSKKMLRWLLWGFLAATVLASLVGLSAHLGWLPEREGSSLAYFVSEVRFGWMVAMATFVSAWFFWEVEGKKRWTFAALSIGLAMFLGVLAVMSAIAGFLLALLVTAVLWVRRERRKWLRTILVLGMIGVPFLFIAFIGARIHDHYTVKDDAINDKGALEQRTARGNPYTHHRERKELENGYYVWLYIAEDELKKAWNARSELPFSGTDRKGQQLRRTLIRYMTSRGLKKDANGVRSLSKEDIMAIENGVANVEYRRRDPLTRRVDRLIFEVDRYLKGHDPSGNSLTQRFEFWRAGWSIFKEHPLIGVGTGDVKKAFEKAYARIDTPLDPEYRLRAHNQYLTMLITFGPLGLLIFLWALFYPPFRYGKFSSSLFLAFFSIALMAFMSEDVLETQAGITFFVFFHCVLGMRKKEMRSHRTGTG